MMKYIHIHVVFSSLCALLLFSCNKGNQLDNLLPQTSISLESINLSGENRLNSLITLNWHGTDPDGNVTGYEFSFDQTEWFFTINQDSTFLFTIGAGSDTIDIDFWVRAIDNSNESDDSPAYLSIPLKNTPPEIAYNEELIPKDTAFNVLFMSWAASDLDGDNTIKDIQIKLNNGSWTSVQSTADFVSIIPTDAKTVGQTTGTIWYDIERSGPEIDGLILDGTNIIYIKAIDIAGSESIVDTLENVVVTAQKNDLLLIGANGASPDAFYKSTISAAGSEFDFIDFVREDAKNQPKIWNPVFTQILRLYKTVVLYSNDIDYINAQTKSEDIILEFASTSIQDYMDQGGRMLISSSLPNDFSPVSPLNGIIPMDSLSSSLGQARLPIDSLVIGSLNFPTLTCREFISGLDPFYPSTDATIIYNAQLTRNNNWQGPSIVGAKRSNSAQNTNMIFFSVELHRLNKDQPAMDLLFDKVLNEEFNW